MQVKNIALQLALAGISLAQLQTVQTAITNVQDALSKVDTAVKALSDANSATALQQASSDAETVIKQSTDSIQGAQQLSLQDALTLQNTASALTQSVQTTVQDLSGKKSTLDQLGATQQAIQSLKDQKTSSDALGKAIIDKVPAVGQGIAQQNIDQIDQAIDQGITALGGNPNNKRRGVHFRV